MNGAAFPSPTAEMAEMNRIHYELEYTEGISQQMRIPEMLKVAPYSSENQGPGLHEYSHSSAMMQVPERIVIAGWYIFMTQSTLTILNFVFHCYFILLFSELLTHTGQKPMMNVEDRVQIPWSSDDHYEANSKDIFLNNVLKRVP